MTYWWISTPRMTVYAEVCSAGTIASTSPITRVFVGQPIESLVAWLARQGGLRVAILPNA